MVGKGIERVVLPADVAEGSLIFSFGVIGFRDQVWGESGAGGDDALNPLLDRQVSRMHLVRTEDIDIAEIKMIGRHIDRDVFSSLISDLQLHLMSDKTEA